MKTVWCLDQVVIPLVAGMVGIPAERFEGTRSLALVDGNQIVGGFIFGNWSPETGVIEVTAASMSKRWMNRSILQDVAKYAYETCGCQAMVARTTEDNPAARIWRALGSEEVSVPHARGRGKPELVFVLTDEAWAKSKFARHTDG